MGLFNKLFGNKTPVKPQKPIDSNEVVIKKKKDESIKPLKKNIFRGMDKLEVKNHIALLLTDTGDAENIEKKIEIILSSTYENSEKDVLTKFIKSNKLFNSPDFKNTLQSDILLRKQAISEGGLSSLEIWNATNNIEYLNSLKNKEIIFCLRTNSSTIIIFSDNGKLKILDSYGYWNEIKEYDVFDISFIFNFFDCSYNKRYFFNKSGQKALERYELLNSDLGKYIDEYFNIIKISKGDRGPWEYGFLFENSLVTIKEFIDSIKRFVFVSNLYDAIIPIIKYNSEKALSNFKIDSSNKLILVEIGFDKLLRKNQNKISEIDKNYVHKFVKLSSYLNKRKENIETFYSTIDKNNLQEIQIRITILNELNQTYEMLIFHSINMIGSLMGGDLVSFYEIYEVFDKLGVFNSNWENEISGQLSQIGNSILELIDSIHEMENNIVGELKNLTYVTQSSFDDLNKTVTNQLKEVESSINTNNLLAGIQAYQLYKINKNTKGIR
jgi:hypothetical protein